MTHIHLQITTRDRHFDHNEVSVDSGSSSSTLIISRRLEFNSVFVRPALFRFTCGGHPMALSYVTDAPTLATCALASLTFHDLAIPLLYHTVCLENTSWTSTVDALALFLHGVLASTADEKALQRKMRYLRHLKALILHDGPRRPLSLPSLH
jgi:hypothetical protein